MRQMRSLARDDRGSMAIEMAFTAPILILLALGSADVSRMISRQNELQSGVAQAEQIALANSASLDTNALKTLLMQSLNLPSSNVTVENKYRCNATATLVSSSTSCASTDVVSTYVKITLTDSYNPLWRGVVPIGTWNFNVVRMVQLS